MTAQGKAGPAFFENCRALETVNLWMADCRLQSLKPKQLSGLYFSLGEILEVTSTCLGREVNRE